jgi:hypothetical protein
MSVQIEHNYCEPNNLGDLLKQEAEKYFSRDAVILASGQSLKLGTVVAKLKANEKAVVLDLTTKETPTGAEIAYGVLIQDTDATTADKETVIIARDAVVASHALIWPEGITADQKKAAINQLKERGILVRKGA